MIGELIPTGVTFGTGRKSINNSFSGTAQFNNIALDIGGDFSGGTSGGVIFSAGTDLYSIINLASGTSGDIWSASTGLKSIIANNGTGNFNNGTRSSILGGNSNTISGATLFEASICGGDNNLITFKNSFIGGGSYNSVFNGLNSYSSIIGGNNNAIDNSSLSFIGGGSNNIIIDSDSSFIGGGRNNTASGYYSFIGSGSGNTVHNGYVFSLINGGRNNNVYGNFTSVVGGENNTSYGNYSFIGGGKNNNINASYSSIIAGNNNLITAIRSSILAGSNLTASTSDTSYTQRAYIDEYLDLSPQTVLPLPSVGRLFFSGTPLFRLMVNTGGTVADWIIS